MGKIKKTLARLYKKLYVRVAGTPQRQLRLNFIGMIVILPALIFSGLYIANNVENNRSYSLTTTTQHIIAKPNKALAKELSYDASSQTYTLNKAAFTSQSSTPDSMQVGSGDTATTTLFGAKLPADAGKGISIVDKTTGISFSITPQFNTMPAKSVQDNGRLLGQETNTNSVAHIVYPINNQPSSMVYTFENNGVKEDVVLTSSPKQGKLSLSYKLNLPRTLAARLMPNGALGIYSADPALFGNISYGSSKDQALVQKSRISAPKNNLVFILPAPVIHQSGDKKIDVNTTLKFSLHGNTLTVTAAGLKSLNYPISIDPSIVDSSASVQFGSGAGDINSNSSGISTANVAGGTLGSSWIVQNDTTGTGYNGGGASGGGAEGASSVVYNGYLYVMGGLYNSNGSLLTTVNYTHINSDGSINGWSSTTGLPVAMFDFAAVAYNGYMYIIGGSTTGTQTTANLRSQTSSIAINSDGTLGSTWTSRTAISISGSTTPLTLFGAVAYNGYMYIFGGMSVSNGVTGTFNATTEYTAINADGSLGSWTTSGNNFPSSGAEGTSVAEYNGYVYVVPDCLASTTSTIPKCTASTGSLLYAPLLGSGGIGSWISAGSIPSLQAVSAFTISDGYLYIIGGNSVSSYSAAVEYAQLNSDGSIGSWRSTTGLANTNVSTSPPAISGARSDMAIASYNNVLYITGGRYNNTISYDYDTQYAVLDPAGINSSFTTSGNSAGTERGVASVAYGGYLYELGGDNTTVVSTAVTASLIGANGAPGVFSATGMTALPSGSGRTYIAAVAYNGYMYVLGGCTNVASTCTGAGSVATVYSAQITASNGDIGTWNLQASFTNARYGLSAVVYNNFLYILGGVSSTNAGGCTTGSGPFFCNDVQYASIGSGGSIVSWTSASSSFNLPSARAAFGATVYGGYLYIAGGCTAGDITACTSKVNDVDHAQLSSGGGFGSTWNTSSDPAFTTPRSGLNLMAYKGYLYLTAGFDGSTYYGDVQYAPLSTSGAVGSWAPGVSYASVRGSAGAAIYNGYLYVMSGYSGSTLSSVVYAQINNGGPDTLGSFATTNNFSTTPGWGGQTIAYNGYLYVLGGCTAGTYPNCTSASSTIRSVLINSNGTVGTWGSTTTGLPSGTGRYDFGAGIYAGNLYITGGCTASCTTPLGDTQSVPIGSSGNITSSWTNLSSFTTARFAHAQVINNGYLYVLGGCSAASSGTCSGSYLNTTYYVQLNNSGGLANSWAPTAAFTTGRDNFGAISYNGTIYIMGGLGSGATDLVDAQYAPLNSSTGAIGSWANTTPLPYSVDSFSLAAYNGELYIFGGNAGGQLSTVNHTEIDNSGTLGQWQVTSSLTDTGRYGSSAAPYNGFVYVAGGYHAASDTACNGSSSNFCSDVQEAGIDSVPRIANYSYQVDLTGGANDPSPDAVVFNGTNAGNPGLGGTSGLGTGGIQASYALASNACSTYGAIGLGSSTANPLIGGSIPLTPIAIGSGCSTVLHYGRFITIYINLDDSQTASFPDSSGNHTTITSFTIYYHPQPSFRLRGGASFANTAQCQSSGLCLQTLDTTP